MLISSLPYTSNIGYLQLYLEIYGFKLELHLYIRASLSIPAFLKPPPPKPLY